KENNKEIGSLNDEIPIDDCIIIGSLSPRKNYVDNSALRKYNYNQGKVRERLITLLNASGLRVGLPKSASMIFSQSLHDVVYEASASLSSSTEKVPLEHVGGDIDTASSLNAPDPSLTDSFPRVFREFDFLEAEHDSVSESTESCFNWLSTMRPRSISKVNMETDEQYQDDEYTEIANGQNQHSSNASDSLEASSERTPLPSEIRSEASLSEVESSCDDEINEEEEYAMGDEHQRMVDTSSIAESVQCNHSEISEVQTSHKLRLFFECNHHSSSQSEQQWLSCLSEIANDTTADLTSHATILFSQLFRVGF
ncbi:unnamed protein product, partial [Dracunculus medinensis]|uniref:Fry_C domain-containing protein n=1 Tax=Dracunculus medinensis TaxID=318479 RepID=A0A0N4UKE8_DRAME